MKRYISILCIFSVAACLSCSVEKTATPIPSDTSQLILVVTEDMNAPAGMLQRFEKDAAGSWVNNGAAIPTMIGKNGLGWGIGLHPEIEDGILKKEGDGKAPAGVFNLSSVFGFKPSDSTDMKMPYLHVTDALECVDDGSSIYYNRIVSNDTIAQPDWNSSEKMLAVGETYAIGVTVDHNPEQIAGRGSCIFLHIWGGVDDPTIGCTSVETKDMQRIAVWLDPDAKPVLVQLAEPDYQQLKEKWQLPAITVED
ncbi:MAG: hypothetical protein AAFP70_05275 [Calditrichota bacterium]